MYRVGLGQARAGAEAGERGAGGGRRRRRRGERRERRSGDTDAPACTFRSFQHGEARRGVASNLIQIESETECVQDLRCTSRRRQVLIYTLRFPSSFPTL